MKNAYSSPVGKTQLMTDGKVQFVYIWWSQDLKSTILKTVDAFWYRETESLLWKNWKLNNYKWKTLTVALLEKHNLWPMEKYSLYIFDEVRTWNQQS